MSVLHLDRQGDNKATRLYYLELLGFFWEGKVSVHIRIGSSNGFSGFHLIMDVS